MEPFGLRRSYRIQIYREHTLIIITQVLSFLWNKESEYNLMICHIELGNTGR
jgi:hypothetical protein